MGIRTRGHRPGSRHLAAPMETAVWLRTDSHGNSGGRPCWRLRQAWPLGPSSLCSHDLRPGAHSVQMAGGGGGPPRAGPWESREGRRAAASTPGPPISDSGTSRVPGAAPGAGGSAAQNPFSGSRVQGETGTKPTDAQGRRKVTEQRGRGRKRGASERWGGGRQQSQMRRPELAGHPGGGRASSAALGPADASRC